MGHSFRLEDNIKKSKKTRMDYSLILMIFFILVAISCLVIYFVMADQNTTTYMKKENTKKEYIYTQKKAENENSESGTIEYDRVPAINLKGSKYRQINNQILNSYEELVKKIVIFITTISLIKVKIFYL